MEYAKDTKNDSPYVSVNTLIRPQKYRGLSVAPPAPAIQTKDQERESEDLQPEETFGGGLTAANGSVGASGEGAPNPAADQAAPAVKPPAPATASSEAGTSAAAVVPEGDTQGAAPETASSAAPTPEAGPSEEVKEKESMDPVPLENVPSEEGAPGTESQETESADISAGEPETESPTPEQELEEEAGSKSTPKTKPVQTKSMAAAAAGAEAPEPGISVTALNSVRSSGEPLPEALGHRMGQAMGADFSGVRVHQDTQSASLAGQLGAKAFTHGTDIYFNRGQYNPDTSGGQHLLAHELAHVEQQRTVPSLQTQLEVPAERDRYEREADTVANQVVGSPASVQRSQVTITPNVTSNNSHSIQLKEDDEKSNSNWIMDKVGGFIRNIPGYDVLTLIIGRDPITGQEVKRDGIAFVKAIVGLIPGGKAIFENLEKAGVITRAVAWFKEEFKKLDLSFNTIKSLFNQAVEAIFGKPKKDEGFFSKLGRGLVNLGKALLSPVETFNKLKHIFMGPIGRILNFIGSAGMKLLEFVFEGALTLVGAPVNMIMGILNKGKEVLGKIIKDPIGFLKNLLNAVKNGLSNFVGNIVAHLQNGLVGWLFGALSNAGITLPDKFSLAGIFSVVSQILGVTWQAIKGLIIKGLGPIAEKVIGVIEKSVGFVVTLITKGPMALLDMAQEFLDELKTMFFDSLIEWVRNTIIVKAIQKLISMFNPVGAIIQAVITIYNTIQFFIERAKQIAAFVGAVFNSIAEIANGNLGKAIVAVEGALAKGLPVAISFLANLIGLGGIAKKIQEIIKKVRKPIDKVIGKVVGFIVDKGKKIWAKMKSAGKKVVKGVKNKVGQFIEWWKTRREFVNVSGEKHKLFFQGEGASTKLMIASKLSEAKKYLQSDEVKGNPENKPYTEKAEQLVVKITAIGKGLPGKKKKEFTPEQMKQYEEQQEAMTELSNILAKLQGNNTSEKWKDNLEKMEKANKEYTIEQINKNSAKINKISSWEDLKGWLLKNSPGHKKIIHEIERVGKVNYPYLTKAIENAVVKGTGSQDKELSDKIYKKSYEQINSETPRLSLYKEIRTRFINHVFDEKDKPDQGLLNNNLEYQNNAEVESIFAKIPKEIKAKIEDFDKEAERIKSLPSPGLELKGNLNELKNKINSDKPFFFKTGDIKQLERAIIYAKNVGNMNKWPWLAGIEVKFVSERDTNIFADLLTIENEAQYKSDERYIREIKWWSKENFDRLKADEKIERIRTFERQITDYIKQPNIRGVIVEFKAVVPKEIKMIVEKVNYEYSKKGKICEIKEI